MSRFPVAVVFASLLVGCGGCSKNPDTPQAAKPTADPLPAVRGTRVAQPAPDTMTPANDASYQLAVSMVSPAATGAEAIARVSVTPAEGWKVNTDFPTSLRLEPPAGVKMTRALFNMEHAAKADDDQLTFDVKLVATRPGTYQVGGEIKFAVCTPDSCDPKHRPVAVEVVAQ